MLKSLCPELPWADVVAVGFDLDGTLYDEEQFIVQAYADIALLIAERTGHPDAAVVYDFMCARWREKGSSYPRIFAEACALASGPPAADDLQRTERDCLQVFRQFTPELELEPYVAELLDAAAAEYRLFIITDGRPQLQNAKIDALGLRRWFAPEVIAITGAYGNDCYKPSAAALQHLPLDDVQPEQMLYFGDRDVDRGFSRNVGCHFCAVRVMRTADHA